MNQKWEDLTAEQQDHIQSMLSQAPGKRSKRKKKSSAKEEEQE